MPPPLALLLCTIFVLLLLWVEKQGSRGVSAAMWIPTLWMLINASRPLAVWLSIRGGGNEAGSLPDRVFLTGLAVAGILIIASRRFNWLRALRPQSWLLVLLVYMFLSAFWSDITLISLRRWGRECIVVVMCLVVMSEAEPCRALSSLLRRSAYVLVPFSLILIKYFPRFGRQYGRWSGLEMWTGVTGQKNELGRLCMISVFFLFWALYQRRREGPHAGGRYQAWADVFVGLLALYLLFGSNSSTSLGTLIAGIAAYLGLHWMWKVELKAPRTALLALVIFFVAFGTAAPFVGGANIAVFSSEFGRDSTLTGRTQVWADLLPAMKNQPLLGHGFGSFWTDARRQRYDIPTAHNGYLDVLLDIGEVGLVLLAVWLLSCARQLHRILARNYEWASFAICLLLMILVYNGTESAINELADYMTAVFILAWLAVMAEFGLRSVSKAPAPLSLDEPLVRVGAGNRGDDGVAI